MILIEVFICAFFGSMIGVIGGAYLVVKSAKDAIENTIKDAAKITKTKIVDGYANMI